MAKQTEELVKASSTELERPSWVQSGNVGLENMQNEDIQLPRIGLAQQMSPQLDPSSDVYIDGLRPSDLFNSLTLEPLSKPIDIVILRLDPPRYIQFDEDRNILDMNIQAGDPRTQFTTDEEGNRVKPVATKFLDYIVAMLPIADPKRIMEHVIALSFKGTGLKVAKQLNGLIKFRNAPLYAGKYRLSSQMVKKNNYTFAQFTVQNAGWISEAEAPMFEALYKEMTGKNITIDTDVDFDPSELE